MKNIFDNPQQMAASKMNYLDSLSPFELWQLQKFGHIASETKDLGELYDATNNISSAEEAFIFNNENPQQ